MLMLEDVYFLFVAMVGRSSIFGIDIQATCSF